MSRTAKGKAGSREADTKSASSLGRDKVVSVLICLGLALAVWLALGGAVRCGFVNFDDDTYIYQNNVVQHGLTLSGIRWALTFGEIGHWHPLTWVSHMLDCQLFGMNAGRHHLTSVLIHMVTVVLLFLVLWRMTGALWRSAFVAAVFAVHPLRVESVVWISERKDVLGTLFFVLTVGAYVNYVRQPTRIRYALVVGAFALGLLCKNMLVTLPFVLLLLDWWPLKRFSPDELRVKIGGLIREKILLLMLSVASCVVTFLVPEKLQGAHLPFFLRVENAITSYVVYLRQTFWPIDLAGLYPNPVNVLPLGQVVSALVLMLAFSAVVFVWRSRRPYLTVGWLWYLGMLVPVIGFVQISFYAHADRYTYLPQIGILMLVTWLLSDLVAPWRYRRLVLGLVAAVIIPTLIVCARKQTTYWRNSEVFWERALACTVSNSIAHNNLSVVLHAKGRTNEAIAHLRCAVAINPLSAGNHFNLGSMLQDAGQVEEALVQLETALEIEPRHVRAHVQLGNVYYRIGETNKAITHYRKALEVDPDDALANCNLGGVLLEAGDLKTSSLCFEKALAARPDMTLASDNLAEALAKAALRGGKLSVEFAEKAVRLSGGRDAFCLQVLAATYAQKERFADAVATAQRTAQLASVQTNAALAEAIQQQIQIYQKGSTFRLEIDP